MKKIAKNILYLLLIQILASPIFVFRLITWCFMSGSIKVFDIYFVLILPIMFFLIIARFFVLPIAYKKLEDSQKYELISKFIKKLKQSLLLKIIVLIIAYYSISLCDIYDYYYKPTGRQIMENFIIGLFGSYLVLYAYWFFQDKWKKRKSLLAK